ncbi:MAG: FAD-dependent oxidoreductase [Thermoanaerobaculales bacterium]|jgi:NADPH-dependent 2,4-dienoyl-CoA reductase/sulfur reductase-like enzyme/nitrite reductase/ring-hydroxylating ferredoxin subunit|nr:FAD-dependent oxidoreductase [Thermoanaerobaculales bacterium]
MAMIRVASTEDIKDGRVHSATAGEFELILLRAQGEIRAFSGRCPHQDAPLADGLLSGNRLVCPWHQAVFRASDGELLEPPSLDRLEVFDVEILGDEVWVDIPGDAPDDGPKPRQPEVAREDRAADPRTVVIVGGGAAGVTGAQELRRCGFQGRLIMVSDDPHDPYDRTHCSKGYLAGEAPAVWLPLKPETFFRDAGIELVHQRLNVIDVQSRRIALPGGSAIEADGLLLAMGSRPRRLPVPGAELDGVLTLRTRTDSERIARRADAAEHVVVVGASFIGMEVAASLTQRGVSRVTVVAPDEVPFASVMGVRVGEALKEIHAANGVEFRLGRNVAKIDGNEKVEAVVLDTGESLATELVVVGIGGRPATDGLEGVELEDDGSVMVDELMRVAPGVFAAGDIATYPDFRTGEPIRIEHWRTAQQQGMIAGRNLAGEAQPFRGVPFFWTMQFGAGLGYVGHAESWDEEIVHGSLENFDFTVFYLRDGRVLAGAAAAGRDRQLNALHELMQLGRRLSAADIGDPDVDLTRMLSP